jgi:hypothetical protein
MLQKLWFIAGQTVPAATNKNRNYSSCGSWLVKLFLATNKNRDYRRCGSRLVKLFLATNRNRDYRSCGSWLIKLFQTSIRTEITEVGVHGWSNSSWQPIRTE